MSIKLYKLIFNGTAVCGEQRKYKSQNNAINSQQIGSLKDINNFNIVSSESNSNALSELSNEDPDTVKLQKNTIKYLDNIYELPQKFQMNVVKVTIVSYNSSSCVGTLKDQTNGIIQSFHRDVFGSHFWMVHFLQMLQLPFSAIVFRAQNDEICDVIHIEKDFFNQLQKTLKKQGIVKKYKKQIMKTII